MIVPSVTTSWITNYKPNAFAIGKNRTFKITLSPFFLWLPLVTADRAAFDSARLEVLPWVQPLFDCRRWKKICLYIRIHAICAIFIARWFDCLVPPWCGWRYTALPMAPAGIKGKNLLPGVYFMTHATSSRFFRAVGAAIKPGAIRFDKLVGNGNHYGRSFSRFADASIPCN